MALKIEDVESLNKYVRGVMDRAAHHAPGVQGIALTLAGAILWRMKGTHLDVLTKDGMAMNVLWVQIGDRRYAFSYNHDEKCIDMRRNNLQGTTVFQFDSTTSASDVWELFGGL